MCTVSTEHIYTMLAVPTWLLQLGIAVVISAFFIWRYSVRKFDYWKKRGVYYLKPSPFVGNLWDVVIFKRSLADWVSDVYFSTNEKIFGIFFFNEPALLIKDPKIVQLVMVKDSDNFINRSTADAHDEVMKNFMFFQKGSDWITDRKKLTPVFTPSKLKGMYDTINNIGENMVRYFDKQLGKIDAKDISARYSTDVIAKCAFGIDAYCFDDKDSDFRKFSKRMFQFTFRNAIAQMSYFFRHDLVRTFQIDLFSADVRDYFCRAFKQSMISRGRNPTKVNDFLDLLIEVKNAEEVKEEIALEKACGQAIMFFAAGFDSVSSAISFTLHELCLNEVIQNRVRSEIQETLKKHGAITYEAIQEMKYLKSCVYETLRKYPSVPFLSRECLTEYAVPGTDIVIEKGVPVYIPLTGLHMDEKYFPDPRRYDPDRFKEHNVNENGLFYLPFGEGPRRCIGDRFGLVNTQIGLTHILSNFEVKRCAETPDPIEFEPKSLINRSKVGLPMRLRRITPTRDP